MNKLNELIDESLIRYKQIMRLDEMDEDIRNKIIFEAVQDARFDVCDIIIDGNFNLVKLMILVNDNKITTNEMFSHILYGLRQSVSKLVNILTEERSVNILQSPRYHNFYKAA